MGRKKDKEKQTSTTAYNPVTRFLGRSNAPLATISGGGNSSSSSNSPKAIHVTPPTIVAMDKAQNGGVRLRYYGTGDGPERLPPHSSHSPGALQNHVAASDTYSVRTASPEHQQQQQQNGAARNSFSSFGVPAQPQTTAGATKATYHPPSAANLLSFQPSPNQSPHHHVNSPAHTTLSYNNSAAAMSTDSSYVPVVAQVHQNMAGLKDKSKSDEDLSNAANSSPSVRSKMPNGKAARITNGSAVIKSLEIEVEDEPLSDGIVRGKDRTNRRHSTGESPPERTQSPSQHRENSGGNKSPGSQSLASINSAATVISNSGPGFELHGRERGKQTLGDILGHIEMKARCLVHKEDFTTQDTLADLQFLAHQSRYNSDMAIKRRIILKLVDCNVVEIFLNVFNSTHKVNYLNLPNDGENGRNASQSETKSSVESVGSSNSSNESSGAVGGKIAGKPPASGQSPVEGKSGVGEKLAQATEAMKNLRAAVTIIWNATEKSTVLCEECVTHGVANLILSDLADPSFVANELNKDQNRLYLVKGYLSILQNIIRFHNDAREVFRSASAVKILQQYLKSSLLMVKTKTIMLLSYIMSESENDIVNASDKNLGFIIKMLQDALKGEAGTRYSKKYGYWAVEAAAGLNRLACFEANKERIVTKGGLPLYVQLLQKGCTEEENLIAAKGVWILAFNSDCKESIRSDAACIAALERLETESGREEIRKTACGALWIINNRNVQAQAPPPPPSDASSSTESTSMNHVLISYQWGSKVMVHRVKERLRAAGYKICTDVDVSGESGQTIMDGMADTVSRAAVVLVCMSQKYKDSPSCRTEAEYARDLGKGIIPLRLQPKYNPDGWLGDLVGAKLFFDLSRGDNVDKMIPNLIRELGPRGRRSSMDLSSISDGAYSEYLRRSLSPLPPPQLQEQCVQVSPEEEEANLATWTNDDVALWLARHSLADATHTLKHLNGELLVQVRKMRRDAPETYHSVLRSELGFDFLTILKFNNALDKI